MSYTKHAIVVSEITLTTSMSNILVASQTPSAGTQCDRIPIATVASPTALLTSDNGGVAVH